MEFNSFFIQTARQADILQVANKLGIEVKKRGINYVTHCFIHDDTNPSLYISPAKNIWSCFACGMGGDPIAYLLKQKRALPEEWSAQTCLFGLHQLNQERFSPVAVVESEKTAIICSELLADERFLWMASGGFSRLSAKLLEPLKGRKVILIPDTDADGTAYQGWLRKAEEAKRLMDQPITVSDLLERFATGEEKSRKIDLADFLIARLDD